MASPVTPGRDSFPPASRDEKTNDDASGPLAGDYHLDDEGESSYGRRHVKASSTWPAPNSLWTTALSLAALTCGLLFFNTRTDGQTALDELVYPHRKSVWSEFGEDGLVRVGTRPIHPLVPCTRTILFDWSRYRSGLGSLITSSMHVMLFAKQRGYEVVFAHEGNAYGTFLDSFQPKEWTTCRPTADAYNAAGRHPMRSVELNGGPAASLSSAEGDIVQLVFSQEDAVLVNHWIRNTTFGELSELDSLPATSGFAPVPGSDTVPALFRQRFLQYSALAAEYFQLNPKMRALRDKYKWDLGLEGTRERPVIGVHFRGGDKIARECFPSAHLSCGNITVHCMAALDALTTFAPAYPTFDPLTAKARLLLMSAEPDAPQLFRADPLCTRHFDVESFAHGATNKPYNQVEFQRLPLADRLADTHSFLAQLDILANWVDATVVSANSNAGRVILTRAGPARVLREHRIRSVDIPWHPFHYPPFAGYCDGTEHSCYPPAKQ